MPLKAGGTRNMRSLEKIRITLRNLESRIKKEYKAEVVGIFGSYARGEQKKRSDIDVIVRFGKGATLFDLVGLADLLEERLGLKVDVVPERAIRKELKEQILNEAVAV